MRKLLLAIALTAGVEDAALACSCIAPSGPEEARADARQIAPNVVAIVEAVTMTPYRPGPDLEWGVGEQVRVQRTLFGKAPRTLRLARGRMPSSASCDLMLDKGQRKVLILSRGRKGAYRMQGLCSDYLTSERYLPILLDEARKSRGHPAKAGKRASVCAQGGRLTAAA